jgi:hypothetical protein
MIGHQRGRRYFNSLKSAFFLHTAENIAAFVALAKAARVPVSAKTTNAGVRVLLWKGKSQCILASSAYGPFQRRSMILMRALISSIDDTTERSPTSGIIREPVNAQPGQK